MREIFKNFADFNIIFFKCEYYKNQSCLKVLNRVSIRNYEKFLSTQKINFI